MIAETMEKTTTRSTAARPYLIRKAAVLGAGNMGSRIAAHFANAGVPVVLLDIVPQMRPPVIRPPATRIVNAALEGLKKSKPAAFFDPANIRLIQPGNFEDDLELLRDCDWIIEAVAENLEIKRALLGKGERLPPRRCHHHHQHQRTSGLANRRATWMPASKSIGSAPTSLIRRATCVYSKSFLRRMPTRPR